MQEINLSHGDTIVMEINAGRMPTDKVRAYLDNIKSTIRGTFPDSVKILIVPVFEDRLSTQISIIHNPALPDEGKAALEM